MDAIERVIDDRRRLDYVLEHRAGGIGDQAATLYARLTEENRVLRKEVADWDAANKWMRLANTGYVPAQIDVMARAWRAEQENQVLREALEVLGGRAENSRVHGGIVSDEEMAALEVRAAALATRQEPSETPPPNFCPKCGFADCNGDCNP